MVLHPDCRLPRAAPLQPFLQPAAKLPLVRFGLQGQHAWHGKSLAARPFGSIPLLGVCQYRCAPPPRPVPVPSSPAAAATPSRAPYQIVNASIGDAHDPSSALACIEGQPPPWCKQPSKNAPFCGLANTAAFRVAVRFAPYAFTTAGSWLPISAPTWYASYLLHVAQHRDVLGLSVGPY